MKKMNKKGFTLVELLLVIAIIGILAAVLFVSLGKQRERARTTTFKENMRGLVAAYTACADGAGTIVGGTATGATTGDSAVVVCSGGTSGINGHLPKITQCNDAAQFVTIGTPTDTGDSWQVTASCNRSGGTADNPLACNAVCTAGGCTFTGTCD